MGWLKAVTPKQLNDVANIYHGQWTKEMDRCWIREEDGLCVSSRLIRVPDAFGGKIEHVTITRGGKFTADGSGDLSWAEKQQIKNELFGEKRCAIEIFPKTKKLVDVCDVYHLWVFDKKFDMPFGIHPSEYTKAVNRGYSMSKEDLEALKSFYDKQNDFKESE